MERRRDQTGHKLSASVAFCVPIATPVNDKSQTVGCSDRDGTLNAFGLPNHAAPNGVFYFVVFEFGSNKFIEASSSNLPVSPERGRTGGGAKPERGDNQRCDGQGSPPSS